MLYVVQRLLSNEAVTVSRGIGTSIGDTEMKASLELFSFLIIVFMIISFAFY